MNDKDTEIIKGFLGFHTILIIAILLFLVFGTSACCHQVGVTRSEYDSTRVDIRYIEKEILRTDTVLIHLPAEKVMDIQSSYSHLETSLATSTAWVDSSYMIRHTLGNKAVSAPIQVIHKDREIVRDSIVYRDRIEQVEVVQERVRHGWKWGFIGFGIGVLMMFILWIRGR